MAADNKQLKDTATKAFLPAGPQRPAAPTPHILTPSDPFSNPIPFPVASCPE